MNWVWSHAGYLWGLVLAHLGLAVPPIVIGFVISVPLGYWASRSRIARGVLLTVGNILYTIPGLALIVFVPVALGLSLTEPLNTALALTLYALALLVRASADAFASVPVDVSQSAVSQGFAPLQRFLRVELPLAGPVLLAGVRVVSVSTISLATVGSLVGISSLGDLFIDGYQRNFLFEAIVGLVLVLVLAALLDVVLTAIGRVLMPWNRGRSVRGAPRARVEALPVRNASGVV